MSNTFGIDTTAFDIFLKSDEQRLHQLYLQHRTNFVDWAIENFDCNAEQAGNMFLQAFTILYLNVKSGMIKVPVVRVEEYLSIIGESLLIKKYGNTIGQKMEQSEKVDLKLLDFEVIHKQQERYAKLTLINIFCALKEPCNTVLKLYFFCRFSIEAIAQQVGYKNERIAKSEKYQCLQELKATILNRQDLREALLNN